MTNEQAMKDAIDAARISHGWMLATIKYQADQHEVEYSDELKLAIATQELLENLDKG